MKKQVNKGFSIVMADDDIDDHILVKQAIRECGINNVFTSVYNGLQLMDFLLRRGAYHTDSESPPDLILIDITMHLMNGFEVLSQIKKTAHLKKIPVYILTTSSSESDKEKALQLGVDGFYTKPAKYEDLKVVIEEICDKFLIGNNN